MENSGDIELFSKIVTRSAIAGMEAAGPQDVDTMLVETGGTPIERCLATLARIDVVRAAVFTILVDELKVSPEIGQTSAAIGASMSETTRGVVIANMFISEALTEDEAAEILVPSSSPVWSDKGAVRGFLKQIKSNHSAAQKTGTPSDDKKNKEDEMVFSLREVDAYFRREANRARR